MYYLILWYTKGWWEKSMLEEFASDKRLPWMYQAISSDTWIKVINKNFYMSVLEKECIGENSSRNIINIKSSCLKACE